MLRKFEGFTKKRAEGQKKQRPRTAALWRGAL